VNIDHVTYRKYRRVPAGDLQLALDEHVKRNRSNPSEGNYAKIKLKPDSNCPFLDEERLCCIQLGLGEECLSDVCATYPRTANVVNEVLEKSATMSCPEAARLALLNPAGIEFDEIDESYQIRNIISKELDTHKLAVSQKPARYFWELRIFTIQVLQNRAYTLAERLIVLGMFFQRLQQQIEVGQITEISNIIATYTNLLDGEDLRAELTQIPVQVTIQMELLKELADERVVKGINSQRYKECFIQFMHGIQYTREAKVEEIADRYQEAEKNYYRSFMTENEYILENYLVNHVFKNLFPLNGEKNIFDNYVMLVVHYALIKLHLIGIAGFHKGLSQELVIKLIQSFAKTVEHNAQYLNQIFELLKKNEYTTMAYMAIMIKN
jgi:lysine-N-methylase